MAELLWRTQRRTEAAAEFRLARQLAQQNDDHIALAWIYGECPDQSLREPSSAVKHARLAVAADRMHLPLLGIAEYRAGDWKEAVESLLDAVQRPGGGDSRDFFYLAMAYHHLNDADAAARWYGQAMAELERPSMTEIDRIDATKAEALQLIEH